MRELLQKIHWLSFDVVVGAMLCAAAASKLPDGTGEINYWAICVLGLVVWLIYTVDRLLDIRKKPRQLTDRHQFHARHASSLWKICIGIGIVTGAIACFLPLSLIRFGLIMGSLCGGYLLLVNQLGSKSKLHFLKEPLTALLYTAGIWGIAFTNQAAFSTADCLLALMFGCIAFQNLLLFSWMETHGKLTSPNFASILRDGFPDFLIRLLCLILLGCFLYVSVEEIMPYQRRFVFTELLMSIILLEIRRNYSFYLVNDRYRWLGDGVFLLMGWLL
ncbi:MAG: hypothetical protein QM669_04275 [Siphonobacter sp.]